MKRSTSFVAALLFVFLTAGASAQIIVNGGFETGDFFAWVVSDPSNFTEVNNSPQPPPASHSGNYHANLGASPTAGQNPGTLLQTLNTTPGQTYQLSFWLASDKSTPTATVDNYFKVFWDSSLTPSLSLTDVPPQGGDPADYVHFTIDNLTATGATTPLKFEFVNNDDFFRLDDVTLNVVPETSTVWLALIGFAFVGFISYRRRKVSGVA